MVSPVAAHNRRRAGLRQSGASVGASEQKQKMKSILSKAKPFLITAVIAIVAIMAYRKLREKTVKEDGSSFLPAV